MWLSFYPKTQRSSVTTNRNVDFFVDEWFFMQGRWRAWTMVFPCGNVCELIVIAMRESGPGLLQCLDTLMIAETNIDFAYALMPSPEGRSMLAMHVEDYEFAVAVLHQSGFMLMYQEDLSR